MRKILTAAFTVAALSAAPALALDVTRTTIIAAEPATVWKTIGRFCGWHPAVETCAPSAKAR